jgi:rubrerythrin
VPRPIATIEEFYAHALAIEREAVARYREFEAWYADRGEDALARLCGGLACVEAEHEAVLARGCASLVLPALEPGEHCWLDEGSPEAPAREFFYRVVSPRQLLEIALKSEMDARDFFERAAQGEGLPELREAAVEMAQEESLHVEWVLAALARYPAPIG